MISLYQLYTQLANKAQRDPNARVRDFKISITDNRLLLSYTSHLSKARDMAATVLALYADSYTESGPQNYKLHWMPAMRRPVVKVKGTDYVHFDNYAK